MTQAHDFGGQEYIPPTEELHAVIHTDTLLSFWKEPIESHCFWYDPICYGNSYSQIQTMHTPRIGEEKKNGLYTTEKGESRPEIITQKAFWICTTVNM